MAEQIPIAIMKSPMNMWNDSNLIVGTVGTLSAIQKSTFSTYETSLYFLQYKKADPISIKTIGVNSETVLYSIKDHIKRARMTNVNEISNQTASEYFLSLIVPLVPLLDLSLLPGVICAFGSALSNLNFRKNSSEGTLFNELSQPIVPDEGYVGEGKAGKQRVTE